MPRHINLKWILKSSTDLFTLPNRKLSVQCTIVRATDYRFELVFLSKFLMTSIIKLTCYFLLTTYIYKLLKEENAGRLVAYLESYIRECIENTESVNNLLIQLITSAIILFYLKHKNNIYLNQYYKEFCLLNCSVNEIWHRFKNQCFDLDKFDHNDTFFL